MKQLKFYIASIAASFIFLTGCAPGLGASVNMNSAGNVAVDQEKIFREEDRIKLNVLSFSDIRIADAMAKIDGRSVRAEGDVALAAQKIFEATAKAAGIKLTLFDAPSIRGSIKEWGVTVTPSFPTSKLEAIASINIELLDKQGKIVHNSLYSGNFSESNPFMSDDKVYSSLGKAMSYAIKEVFKDDVFLGRLSTATNVSHEINY